MSKQFNVTILHDIVGEGDEIIVLDVVSDSGNIINVESIRNQAEITIIEDDSECIVLWLAVSSVYENPHIQHCPVNAVLASLLFVCLFFFILLSALNVCTCLY